MPHVIVVGGSYAGIRALKSLAKEPGVRITLIDRHPYHFLQTESYDLIAGHIPFEETIVGLRPLCAALGKSVTFLHDAARSVDPERSTLSLESGETLRYDYLIVAAGAVTRFHESVEGLREHAYGVKSLRTTFELKQSFEAELYRRLESRDDTRAPYHILIGGAGLSGVEIAAEMQAFVRRYREVAPVAFGRMNIHLADEKLLQEMHPATIEGCRRRLEALGVHLHLGAFIRRVEADRAILENGEEIPFDLMIFTGGIMAAPFVQSLPFRKNRLGQVEVDPFLRAEGSGNLFVVGDSAVLRDRKGEIVAPTAQSAEASGTAAAENVRRLIRGRPLKRADIRLRGLAIALGGKYAILDAGFIRIYGFWAYVGKKAIEKWYKRPLKRQALQGHRKIALARQTT